MPARVGGTKGKILHPPGSNVKFPCAPQLVQNLEYLGFSHMLLLANGERTCRASEAMFLGTPMAIGCVWDKWDFQVAAVSRQMEDIGLGRNRVREEAEAVRAT